jgi:hypothetical protein
VGRREGYSGEQVEKGGLEVRCCAGMVCVDIADSILGVMQGEGIASDPMR